MGRANNSFTSYVGHALEINHDKVVLPEKELWVAVLCRAVLDACKGPPQLDMARHANIAHKNQYTYEHTQARHFFIRVVFQMGLIQTHGDRHIRRRHRLDFIIFHIVDGVRKNFLINFF